MANKDVDNYLREVGDALASNHAERLVGFSDFERHLAATSKAEQAAVRTYASNNDQDSMAEWVTKAAKQMGKQLTGPSIVGVAVWLIKKYS